MKKAFGVLGSTAVIVGNTVGAGFASGREIVLFLGHSNVKLTVALCCVTFFVLTYTLFRFAAIFDCYDYKSFFNRLFGRLGMVADILLSLSYLLILSTLLSASNICLKAIFGGFLPSYSLTLISLFLSITTLLGGIKGLKMLSIFLLPCIIVLLWIICEGKTELFVIQNRVPKFLTYCAFNALVACGVALPLAKNIDIGQQTATAIFSAIIFSFLLSKVLGAVNAESLSNAQMPLAAVALSKGKTAFYAYNILLYLCVFTSICATAFSCCVRFEIIIPDKTVRVIAVFAVGLLLSVVGFSGIVDNAYPLISCFALVVMTTAAIKLTVSRIRMKREARNQNAFPQ